MGQLRLKLNNLAGCKIEIIIILSNRCNLGWQHQNTKNCSIPEESISQSTIGKEKQLKFSSVFLLEPQLGFAQILPQVYAHCQLGYKIIQRAELETKIFCNCLPFSTIVKNEYIRQKKKKRIQPWAE